MSPIPASTSWPRTGLIERAGWSSGPTAASRSTRSPSRREFRELGRGRELGADLLREHEADVLVDCPQLRDLLGTVLLEVGDQPLDQLLGRAGPGGDADRLD